LFSPIALACFVLTAAVGFGLDLWSKHEAFSRLCTGVEWFDGHPQPINRREVSFVPGVIDFTVTTNQGAVFGFGQGKRTLFVVVSAAAILFIGYLFLTSGAQRLYQIILGMLMAGVLGNLYDRLMFSYVRDMIHYTPTWPRPFPYIFNVADSLLCTGVALMVLYSLFHNPDRAKADLPEPNAA
jgi:lipoprotein signal peptidase